MPIKLPKVLVSACLLGVPCRYDGGSLKGASREPLVVLEKKVQWVPICPEEMGGLSTPRPAACCVGGGGNDVLAGNAEVRTLEGNCDVTDAFLHGAKLALLKAEQEKCSFAVLKARSPSCGSDQVYQRESLMDKQALVAGEGVTCALLRKAGLTVFSEESLMSSQEKIESLLLGDEEKFFSRKEHP